MSALFGALNFADDHYVFQSTFGQELVFKQIQFIQTLWNQEAQDLMGLFMGNDTVNHAEMNLLPEVGDMESQGFYAMSPAGETKPAGSYLCEFPIWNFGIGKSWNRIARAYFTAKELEMFMQGVLNASNKRLINDILYCILNPFPSQWQDPKWQLLKPVGLANGDSTIYQPPIGSFTEGPANMYLAPGYAESQLSYTNDPFELIRNTLEPYWGIEEGGPPIDCYVSTNAARYVRRMPDFIEYTPHMEDPGDNITTFVNMRPKISTAIRLGSIGGVMVMKWPRLPTGYMFAIHTKAPKPLQRRRDPVGTGIEPGLSVVPGSNTIGPFDAGMQFSMRYGMGVAKRLSACVVQVNGSGTYTVPSGYTSH